MGGYSMSIYIYELVFEYLWIAIRMIWRDRKCAGRFLISGSMSV
jgi:hypothetical protein